MKDRQLPVVALTLLAAGLAPRPSWPGMALTSVAQVGFLLSDGRNSTLASLIGVAELVVGVASLVLAFGFWLQRSWAWGLGIAVFGLSLGRRASSAWPPVWRAWAASCSSSRSRSLVLWYLYQPKVKALYGR